MCIVADVSGRKASASRSLIVTGRHLAGNGMKVNGADNKRASPWACERVDCQVYRCNRRGDDLQSSSLSLSNETENILPSSLKTSSAYY